LSLPAGRENRDKKAVVDHPEETIEEEEEQIMQDGKKEEFQPS
jgi:hypothetical protein